MFVITTLLYGSKEKILGKLQYLSCVSMDSGFTCMYSSPWFSPSTHTVIEDNVSCYLNTAALAGSMEMALVSWQLCSSLRLFFFFFCTHCLYFYWYWPASGFWGCPEVNCQPVFSLTFSGIKQLNSYLLIVCVPPPSPCNFGGDI